MAVSSREAQIVSTLVKSAERASPDEASPVAHITCRALPRYTATSRCISPPTELGPFCKAAESLASSR